jgi:hypothetical protein
LRWILFVAGLAWAGAAQAGEVVKVCVDVQVKSWTADEPPHSTAPAPSSAAQITRDAEQLRQVLDQVEAKAAEDPFRLDPARYLKRMLEYEVTHAVGYAAVDTGCAEHLTVELYPLDVGWTVFGRFSQNDREEKVDRVQSDELGPLAQRMTAALLEDEPIADTLNRLNVLRADSEAHLRAVDGRGHVMLGVGTAVRVGKLPTADSSSGAAKDETRLLTPISLELGYRGKFQAWAVDAFGRAMLGTQERAARNNDLGGHADYVAGGALGMHFLRYADPPGMTSFYFGAGAQFEVDFFSIIKPKADREKSGDDRDSLFGGGLDLDLLVGYEFMRASSLHFFVQAEADLPTYRIDSEADAGEVQSWMPGGLLQLGILF